jgi:hypothetical protein
VRIEEHLIMSMNIPHHLNVSNNIFSNMDKIYGKYSFFFMQPCSSLMLTFTHSWNSNPPKLSLSPMLACISS